jgi:hypothetical protein
MPAGVQQKIVASLGHDISSAITDRSHRQQSWSAFYALRATSKDLKGLTSDSIKAISLRDDVQDKTISTMVKTFPKVETVIFRGNVTKKAVEDLSAASNLKSIIFFGKQKMPHAALEAVATNRSLEELLLLANVSGVTNAVLSKLVVLPKLTRLSISGNNSVTPQAVAQFSHLRELTLALPENEELPGAIPTKTDSGIDKLASLKDLQRLKLHQNHNFHDEDLEALPRFPSLQALELDPADGLTTKGIAHIVNVPKLKEVVLSGLDGSRVSQLTQNKNLEKITISGFLQNPEQIDFEAFKRHPSLRNLQLTVDQDISPLHLRKLQEIPAVKNLSQQRRLTQADIDERLAQ